VGQLFGFVLTLHSLVRWVTVVVAVAALVRFAWGWWRSRSFERMDRILLASFTRLMDTQMLLGLIFLFGSGFTGGGWPRQRLEHAGLMVVAVIISHLPAMWKKQSDPIRFRNTLFAIMGSLIVIVLAIAALPQGWFG
jgi:hypothetical protein